MATEKTFKTRFIQKHDTNTNWAKTDVPGQYGNLIPKNGEIIVYDYADGHRNFKIGDGIKKVAELPFNDEKIKTKGCKKVCLYYGYPNAINGSWDVNKSVSIYKNYDIIVFGDEYNNPSHEAHADTVKIISALRENYPDIEIFGYVPCAVTGGGKNLPTQEVKNRIDLWSNMNVTGIFYDEFGFDYENTRERQNELIAHGRSHGLNAFVNSWEDLYLYSTAPITISWKPNFQPNPNGIAPILNEKDYSLYENLFWNVTGNIQKASTSWRINKAYEYYSSIQSEYGKTWYDKFKVKTISLDSILPTQTEEEKLKLKTISLIGSKILNIDGVAFGNETWGSNGKFEEWDLPLLNLKENGKHSITMTAPSGYPEEYSSIINGNPYKLQWKLPTQDTIELSQGERNIYINNGLVENVWLNSYEVQRHLSQEIATLKTTDREINSKLDGKANSSHKHGNADITDLDASKLTGTISIDRLPQGALERLVTVTNQAARFALTESNVQLGDTVQQLDTKRMYIVTNISKLSSEEGYTEYTAGSAASVPWSGVTGKPSAYPPESHSHSYLPLAGGTLSGNVHISKSASADMSATSENPKITFSENGEQPVSIIYSDYDNYRAPAGLKIIGAGGGNPAWLEAEGDIYSKGQKIPLWKQASGTLRVASWNSSSSQSISIPGITPNSFVVSSPASSMTNVINYNKSTIVCISQGNGTLTFQYHVKPTSDIMVNIIYTE